jgi:hypothetical protein
MQLAEGVNAAFRKKYGIPPTGKGPHPASAYGLPLPPVSHPAAVPFAHAVIRRAGQATNFDPADVQKQVRKAKAILRTKKAEAVTSIASLIGMRPPARPKVSEEAKNAPLVTSETAFAIREGESLTLTSESGTPVIKDVLIIRSGPGNLGDRNFYSTQALTTAIASKIFEGARAFLDHPTDVEEREQPGRSVKNMGGWFSGTYAAPYTDPETGILGTGLYGDFHPQIGREDVASLIRTCVEYAKMFPRKAYVGLSISAHGVGESTTIDGQPWNRIDEITFVESVDIVTRAGAGGGFLPLRESFKMAKTTKSGDGIGLTIDPAKLEEGAKKLRESLKPQIVAMLEEASKAKVTPEQDKAIDKSLGLVDGGKIDNIVDAATGVDTEAEESEDMDEAAKSPMPDKEDPFREGMTDAEKLAGWKKAKESYVAAKAAADAAPAKMKEAAKLMESATKITRESHVDAVLAEINPPDTFRPRLRRELLESSAKTRDEFKTRAQEFDQAYIRPLHERSGGSHNATGATPGKLTFEYAEN